MAREPDAEDPIELFKREHEATIHRVLERARNREAREAAKRDKQIIHTIRSMGRIGRMSRTLDRALFNQGRAIRNLPSIRLKAPGTGGTSFHFSHTSTTNSRGGRAKGAAGKKGARQKQAPAHTEGAGRAAAHQVYVEREAAVDQTASPVDADASPSRRNDAGLDSDPTPNDTAGTTRASPEPDRPAADPAGADPASYPPPTELGGHPRRYGNVPADRDEEKAFWDRYCDLSSPSDPNAAMSYEDIHMPADSSDTEIDEEILRRTNAIARQGIPFVATIARPSGTMKRPTISITRGTTPLDAETDETGQAAWSFRRLEQNLKSARRARTKENVSESVDDLRDSELQSPGRMQGYVENTEKVSRLHGTTASFGTIGATPEERQAFWTKLAASEAIDGRVQNALVVELPHQATAAQHHEIIRAFTDILTEKGLPFWAAIHQPGKDNDRRNFHAHILFSDRPARLMTDLAGRTKWDFEIVEEITRPNRTVVERRPHRQNKLPEMRSKDFIPSLRMAYSQIVNRTMSAAGIDVRYDPRSYSDMGLHEKPMTSVRRIIADKMKTRRFVALDADWTRRQINRQLETTARQRSTSYTRLSDIEESIRTAAMDYDAIDRRNAKAPNEIRLNAAQIEQKKKRQLTMIERLRIQREEAASRLLNEATLQALSYIVEATDPRTRRGRQAAIVDPNVDPEDLAALHNAAQAELRQTLAEVKIAEARRTKHQHSFASRHGEALMTWARGFLDGTPDATTNAARAPADDLFSRREKIIPPKATPQDVDATAREARDWIESPLPSETPADRIMARLRAERINRETPAQETPASVREILDLAKTARSKGNEQVKPSRSQDRLAKRKNRYGTKKRDFGPEGAAEATEKRASTRQTDPRSRTTRPAEAAPEPPQPQTAQPPTRKDRRRSRDDMDL